MMRSTGSGFFYSLTNTGTTGCDEALDGTTSKAQRPGKGDGKMAEKDQTQDPAVNPESTNDGANDEPYIPGTSWKTKDEAAKGIANQKEFIDKQGNEIGQLRSQVQEAQKAIEQMQKSQTDTQAAASKTDYDAELNTIYEQMEQLDDMDDNYKKDMMALTRKANQLSQKAAEERAANKAAEQFQKTLDERDQQQAYQQFYDANPDFTDPQMQQRIQDHLAKDKTGLEDAMTAFRTIQRDDAAARVAELEKEVAEKNRLLEIKEGAAGTEKVMTKGQSNAEAARTKQPKLSGADLDAEMLKAAQGK